MKLNDVRVGDELIVTNTDFGRALDGARCVVLAIRNVSCTVRWLTYTDILMDCWNNETTSNINVSPCELYARRGRVVFEIDPDDSPDWCTEDYSKDKYIPQNVTPCVPPTVVSLEKMDKPLRSQICQAIMSHVKMLKTSHFYGSNMILLKEVMSVIESVDNEWRRTLENKKASKEEIQFTPDESAIKKALEAL